MADNFFLSVTRSAMVVCEESLPKTNLKLYLEEGRRCCVATLTYTWRLAKNDALSPT